jgi:hypothetical protein
MEVRETAACGISQREFVIELDDDGLVHFYRILLYAQEGIGFYEEDYLEDLKSQLSYIIGPTLEEEPTANTAEDEIQWEDTGALYALSFNEDLAKKLYQVLLAVEHPGENLDEKLNQKLLDQMLAMAPNTLDNLPITNQ